MSDPLGLESEVVARHPVGEIEPRSSERAISACLCVYVSDICLLMCVCICIYVCIYVYVCLMCLFMPGSLHDCVCLMCMSV